MTTTKTTERTAYAMAVAGRQDAWVAAAGGTETPVRDALGRRMLYCYNPGQRRHAYIDLDTDIEATPTWR